MTDDNAPRILVVEDDDHTRELLEFNIENAGYRVIAARNVDDAMGALTSDDRIDLIISDIMMPGLSGFDFRDRLRASPEFHETAFVFLTARSAADDQIRGLESGADEYIVKPFDIDVLLARIQAVIARRAHVAEQVSRDHLTGLMNRQAIESAITRELHRMRRYPATASLAFIDLDDFKELNDTLGHAVGDRALQGIADVFTHMMRHIDLAGRYGGEEFVLYFPETPEATAGEALKRMQSAFKEKTKESFGREMTFSAGIAEAPRDGDAFDVLTKHADTAMFTGKRGGKAQIKFWRPDMTLESASEG